MKSRLRPSARAQWPGGDTPMETAGGQSLSRDGMTGTENFWLAGAEGKEVWQGLHLGVKCLGESAPLLYSSPSPPAFQSGKLAQLIPFGWGLGCGYPKGHQ